MPGHNVYNIDDFLLAVRKNQTGYVMGALDEMGPGLIKNNNGFAVMQAVRNNSAACLDIMLSAGFDPNFNFLTHGHWHLLHDAAHHAGIDIVRILLKHAAETEVLDDMGRTPLMIAAQYAHWDICNALLVAGASAHPKNICGETLDDMLTGTHRAGFQQMLESFYKSQAEKIRNGDGLSTHNRIATRKLRPGPKGSGM